MSPEELKMIFTFLAQYGLTGLVAGLVAVLLLRIFLPGYLAEKGKNLALKEDIAQITEKIEEVKRQHSELLEDLKTRNQLRIAALQERLRAHQEAYQLWREINQALDKPALDEVIIRCDKWWGEHCLYLEPEARSAFLSAFVGARDLNFYRKNPNTVDLVSKVQREINDAGGIIEKCVALPNLHEFDVSPEEPR